MKTQDFLQAVEAVRSHDELMPVQRLATFLFVALRGRVTREEAAEAVGQSTASAYRNLMALSEGEYPINQRRYQGAGWLTYRPDEYEPRRLVWELSPKGKRLLNQIEAIR